MGAKKNIKNPKKAPLKTSEEWFGIDDSPKRDKSGIPIMGSKTLGEEVYHK